MRNHHQTSPRTGRRSRQASLLLQPSPTELQNGNIHNSTNTSHLSFVSWKLALLHFLVELQHDRAYLTQFPALNQTSHFLQNLQATSRNKTKANQTANTDTRAPLPPAPQPWEKAPTGWSFPIPGACLKMKLFFFLGVGEEYERNSRQPPSLPVG